MASLHFIGGERPYPESPLASRRVTLDELIAERDRIQHELDKDILVDSDNARDRRAILRSQLLKVESLMAVEYAKETGDTIASIFEP